MKIVSLDLSKLVFDPNNARKHSAKNLDAIKGSLTKFGQQKPIVVNSKNIVIAGNGTVEAARLLGWKTISATVSALDDFNQAAFALADNRSSELAEWDKTILGDTLQRLREDGLDLNVIGFGEDFLDGLIDIPTFEPASIDDQGKLDEKSKTKCPKCGHEFAT